MYKEELQKSYYSKNIIKMNEWKVRWVEQASSVGDILNKYKIYLGEEEVN